MNPEIINQAIKTLKETQKSFKRHNRVHLETAEDNTHRLRALEETGICRNCDNLSIEIKHQDGHNRTSLRCKKGNSPLELYRQTPLGQKAKCPEIKVNS